MPRARLIPLALRARESVARGTLRFGQHNFPTRPWPARVCVLMSGLLPLPALVLPRHPTQVRPPALGLTDGACGLRPRRGHLRLQTYAGPRARRRFSMTLDVSRV